MGPIRLDQRRRVRTLALKQCQSLEQTASLPQPRTEADMPLPKEQLDLVPLLQMLDRGSGRFADQTLKARPGVVGGTRNIAVDQERDATNLVLASLLVDQLV